MTQLNQRNRMSEEKKILRLQIRWLKKRPVRSINMLLPGLLFRGLLGEDRSGDERQRNAKRKATGDPSESHDAPFRVRELLSLKAGSGGEGFSRGK